MSATRHRRRPFVVTLSVAAAVIEVVLGALVAVGMATGLHRDFAKGQAPLFVVLLVQVLGLLALTVIGRGLYTCARRRRVAPVAGWLAYSAAIWMLWAFVRVGEYAS